MAALPGFEVRTVRIGPGGRRGYDESEWRDALVFVKRGEIELEWLNGDTCRLERGDVLWLAGLPLRSLRNRRHEPALLLAVCRRAPGMTDEFEIVTPSNATRPITDRKEDADEHLG